MNLHQYVLTTSLEKEAFVGPLTKKFLQPAAQAVAGGIKSAFGGAVKSVGAAGRGIRSAGRTIGNAAGAAGRGIRSAGEFVRDVPGALRIQSAAKTQQRAAIQKVRQAGADRLATRTQKGPLTTEQLQRATKNINKNVQQATETNPIASFQDSRKLLQAQREASKATGGLATPKTLTTKPATVTTEGATTTAAKTGGGGGEVVTPKTKTGGGKGRGGKGKKGNNQQPIVETPPPPPQSGFGKLEQMIKDKPLLSTGVAAGGAFMLGDR